MDQVVTMRSQNERDQIEPRHGSHVGKTVAKKWERVHDKPQNTAKTKGQERFLCEEVLVIGLGVCVRVVVCERVHQETS